jgi:hypothetical protein
MNIYIKKNTNYYSPIFYVLKIIEKNKNILFDFVDSKKGADIFWDHMDIKSQVISQYFYNELEKEKPSLSHFKLLKNEPIILDENGDKDYVATIFYMINCLQEFIFKEDDLDQFRRFKYESSYQHRFHNIEENLVQKYIDHIIGSFNIKAEKKKSEVFVSHDIDTIYGSLLQDGFWSVKNLRLDVLLTIIANELIRRPHWKNIDKIINIDSEYDIRSTFFWLVNNGKGKSNIKNADYNIQKERNLLKVVDKAGFINGLHKSCDEMSINEELEKGNLNTTYNRYHFLNFLPSEDWNEISSSDLQLDASLGFAERYGFRNSYGNAFQPYNICENKLYNFVEIPLNLMDGTFHKYMKVNTQSIGNIVIDFFEKNKYNCCLSLLWHNTYFTNYKYNSFLTEYKKIMSYFYEIKIHSLTPHEIIEDNLLLW